MNIQNGIEQAKIIGFAIGKFYEDKEFMDEFSSGTGSFSAIAHLLEKYPDDCINLICAYDGIEKENLEINGAELLGAMFRVLSAKEILKVFQSAE